SSSTTGGRSHGSASAATWCAKTGSAGYTHSSRKAWTRPTYSVVTASGAKSIGVLLSECGVPAGQQFQYHGAELADLIADGQPLGVPAVDAFEDHGELEVGEGDVPVEVADRDPAGRRVPLDQVGAGRPAGQAAGRGRRGLVELVQTVPVHAGEAQVGERVAERGHLPVEYRGDTVAVRIHEGVVQPEVAVHHGRATAVRQRLRQALGQLLRAGQVARPGGGQLLAPAADLPVQEAFRAAEVTEADVVGYHGVQRGERVGERRAESLTGGLGQGPQGGRGAVDHAVARCHEIERCADDGLVAAVGERVRHGYRGRRERGQHGVLAQHVVRGREHVPERRPA